MQGQFQQFVEFFVPPVQFLDRMVTFQLHADLGTAQCTLCRPWRLHRYSSRDGFGRARCCATTGALVGVAHCLVRRWIHVMHHPGWFLEEFMIFYEKGHARLLRSILVLLFWPAHRRQQQWHAPFWFCLFDAPRAMFPRLPAVCRECACRDGYPQCKLCSRSSRIPQVQFLVMFLTCPLLCMSRWSTSLSWRSGCFPWSCSENQRDSPVAEH